MHKMIVSKEVNFLVLTSLVELFQSLTWRVVNPSDLNDKSLFTFTIFAVTWTDTILSPN